MEKKIDRSNWVVCSDGSGKKASSWKFAKWISAGWLNKPNEEDADFEKKLSLMKEYSSAYSLFQVGLTTVTRN